ncbi:MAG: hypothetical protein DCF19_05835 [Pseudanabaena frigida]|uniref:Uncharacterized protein n=1 Tax=Pseudanabaena frigida TaxID=945775 RepID=A0A2W4YKG0_9CYAN|nr:MAG: hypothetical protein DCF19_05835 [Pseudanabaena frigida]
MVKTNLIYLRQLLINPLQFKSATQIMKKLHSFILTTFALLASGLVWNSMPSFAESSTNMRPKGIVKAEGELSSDKLAKLNLSADQKLKFRNITIDTFKKISPILTADQRKKLEEGVKARQGINSILKSLNLTVNQSTKIRPIIIDYKNQLLAVLTPEQKKKLQS